MNRAIRTLVLGLVSAVALSSAGTALAAYTTPKLLDHRRDRRRRRSTTRRAPRDDPTAKLTFYAPTGVLGVADAARRPDDRHRDRAGHGRRPRRRAAAADRHRAGARRERHVPLRHDAGADRGRRDAVHRHRDAHRLLGADPPGRRPDARAARSSSTTGDAPRPDSAFASVDRSRPACRRRTCPPERPVARPSASS